LTHYTICSGPDGYTVTFRNNLGRSLTLTEQQLCAPANDRTGLRKEGLYLIHFAKRAEREMLRRKHPAVQSRLMAANLANLYAVGSPGARAGYRAASLYYAFTFHCQKVLSYL
jgi:hypothetical protein